MLWVFWMNCFWKSDHFHNIISTNPWAWYVFPFSDVFVIMFSQWFEVFILYVFTLLVKFSPRYLNVFDVTENNSVSAVCSSLSCHFAKTVISRIFLLEFWYVLCIISYHLEVEKIWLLFVYVSLNFHLLPYCSGQCF